MGYRGPLGLMKNFLSCLNEVKKMQETGRWNEAQDELERVINLAKTDRERGFGSLLLAELFNKWGAASQSYSADIMDKGACLYSSWVCTGF